MSVQPAPSLDVQKRIAALFPFQVSVSAISFDRAATAHQALTQRRAARRRDFIRGRLCAKRALAGLGVAATAVKRQIGGAPHWPDGVVGSISHTHSLCAAVVALRGAARSLGLDIEHNAAASPELSALILAPGEAAPVRFFGADNWLTALFSAKEAFYKYYFPLHRRFLDFQDCRTAFHAHAERSGVFMIESAYSRHAPFPGIGYWSFDEAHIYTGFSAPADSD